MSSQPVSGKICARFKLSGTGIQKDMKNLTKQTNQNGFSMIELLIAMTITLIILGAVFSLMRSANTTANANYEMTTATQGLRNAQEYITRDILVAGDGLKGLANIWLPTVFVAENLTARSAAVIDPTNQGYLNIGMMISDNNVPNNTPIRYSTPAMNVLPITDRLAILTRDASFSAINLAASDVSVSSGQINIPAARIGDFSNGEIYFISNGAAGVFGTVTNVNSGLNKITWANGDTYGLNRTGSTGQLASVTNNGTYPTILQRVQIIQYFVDAENRLVRRVFGVKSSGYIDSVVAEHLESLSFRYVLKPDDAAVILSQPKAQLDIDESAGVRTIELSLRVRTAYQLQDGDYHEVDGTTQVGVRNIQFTEAIVPRDTQGNTDLPNPGPTPVITPTPPPPPPPTPVPSATPTPPPTPTPSVTPTPSGTATPTPTPPPATPTPTRTPTPTPSPTPVPTPIPGNGEG
jgi:prepilin-type N-terminal cleavage/methylation domain-containing protein